MREPDRRRGTSIVLLHEMRAHGHPTSDRIARAGSPEGCYLVCVTKLSPFALAIGTSLLGATNAHAFENQWHLGAGANGLSYSGDKGYVLPALSLHGAYGLSDVFDVRIETAFGMSLAPAQRGSLSLAELVFAYKIDVIEWIPWVALGAGLFGATNGLQGAERDSMQPASSVWVGLDYAFTREWGIGGVFAAHSWIADSSRSNLRLAATQFGLRIERRFGW